MERKEMAVIGPLGLKYSFGIVADVRRLAFISGQVALDESGAVLAPDNMEQQSKLVFQSMATLLAEAGASLGHVAKITTFVTDMSQYAAFTRVRNDVFEAPYPASTVVEVTALAKPGLVVEVEALAVL